MRSTPPTMAPLADPSPAPRPQRRVHEGRWALVEPLDVATHGAELYAAGCGDEARDRIWTYLPYGPFASEDAFRAYLEPQAVSEDPLFFAIRPHASGRV